MDRANVVYTLLKEVFFTLDAGDRSFLSQYDLTVPRFYTLKHIGENPGITLSELSVLMLSDKGNTSRIIKGMEAEGLVHRRRHASDGRALSLHLSAAGEKICRQAVAAHDAYTSQRFAELSPHLEILAHRLALVKHKLEANSAPEPDG